MRRVPLPRALFLALSLLTPVAAQDASPAAAVEQARIVYQSVPASADSDNIYLMDMDGANIVELAGEIPGEHYHPDWSPDGNRVVFEVLHGEAGTLWTVNADGSAPEALLECEAPCLRYEYPAWSPDATRIAFTSILSLDEYEGPPDATIVQILDIATQEITTVVRTDYPKLMTGPRWSPDGNSIVIGFENLAEDGDHDNGSAIATVPVAGGELQPLTDLDLFAFYPDWNRTNNSIVFSTETWQFVADRSESSYTWNLFTIDPDGTNLRQITDVPEGHQLWQPSWTPDGSRIIATLDTPDSRVAVFVDPESGAVEVIGDHLATHSRLQPMTAP